MPRCARGSASCAAHARAAPPRVEIACARTSARSATLEHIVEQEAGVGAGRQLDRADLAGSPSSTSNSAAIDREHVARRARDRRRVEIVREPRVRQHREAGARAVRAARARDHRRRRRGEAARARRPVRRRLGRPPTATVDRPEQRAPGRGRGPTYGARQRWIGPYVVSLVERAVAIDAAGRAGPARGSARRTRAAGSRRRPRRRAASSIASSCGADDERAPRGIAQRVHARRSRRARRCRRTGTRTAPRGPSPCGP